MGHPDTVIRGLVRPRAKVEMAVAPRHQQATSQRPRSHWCQLECRRVQAECLQEAHFEHLGECQGQDFLAAAHLVGHQSLHSPGVQDRQTYLPSMAGLPSVGHQAPSCWVEQDLVQEAQYQGAVVEEAAADEPQAHLRHCFLLLLARLGKCREKMRMVLLWQWAVLRKVLHAPAGLGHHQGCWLSGQPLLLTTDLPKSQLSPPSSPPLQGQARERDGLEEGSAVHCYPAVAQSLRAAQLPEAGEEHPCLEMGSQA